MSLIHLRQWVRLDHWLLPPTCILCHSPSRTGIDLCQACLDELPILPQSCPQCAKTFPENLICLDCLTSPPPFDATFALFCYRTPVTKLIMELKFHERLVNASILGELMAHRITTDWYHNKRLPDCIIPVPLHVKRLKERGFNQAIEIARPVVKRLGIPLDFTGCKRIKYTDAQAQLDLAHRTYNIKDAFQVEKDYSHQHLAIVDDVTTTGQTLRELSQTLKNAGAKQIDLWCCAKTLLD